MRAYVRACVCTCKPARLALKLGGESKRGKGMEVQGADSHTEEGWGTREQMVERLEQLKEATGLQHAFFMDVCLESIVLDQNEPLKGCIHRLVHTCCLPTAGLQAMTGGRPGGWGMDGFL